MAVEPKRRTILSAGIGIRELLLANHNIKGTVTKVFPVVTDKAELPYIAYRRAAYSGEHVKNGPAADIATMEVECYARSYTESVNLAEYVREALDGQNCYKYGISVCELSDSEEDFGADAFIQRLMFKIM